MNEVKIIIATHKAYQFPLEGYYQPIYVGSELRNDKLDILSDNTGDNISIKNSSFCELTALYWAWKNHFFDDVDYIGLVHYRRYFKGKEINFNGIKIASDNELISHLKNYDCIVPKKRNYYIETIYSHYKNAHFIKDIEITRDLISEKYSSYLPYFDIVMNGKKLHLYNMFVMNKENTKAYCEWLFPILFELENKIDITSYNIYQKRVFGFISERLFNVWILRNNISIKEVNIVNIERENWLNKIYYFLKRKLIGKSK
ncbi:DUF4422 domain-containing protein [Ursidibacter sp. B-7004-1]